LAQKVSASCPILPYGRLEGKLGYPQIHTHPQKKKKQKENRYGGDPRYAPKTAHDEHTRHGGHRGIAL